MVLLWKDYGKTSFRLIWVGFRFWDAACCSPVDMVFMCWCVWVLNPATLAVGHLEAASPADL